MEISQLNESAYTPDMMSYRVIGKQTEKPPRPKLCRRDACCLRLTKGGQPYLPAAQRTAFSTTLIFSGCLKMG